MTPLVIGILPSIRTRAEARVKRLRNCFISLLLICVHGMFFPQTARSNEDAGDLRKLLLFQDYAAASAFALPLFLVLAFSSFASALPDAEVFAAFWS